MDYTNNQKKDCFRTDRIQGDNVADHVKTHFLDYLKQNNDCIVDAELVPFDRGDSKSVNEQYQGHDIHLTYKAKPGISALKRAIIEVKGQTNDYLGPESYAAKAKGDKTGPTPTFSLELYYKKRDWETNSMQEKIGWFLDDNKKSHFYAFVWIHLSTCERCPENKDKKMLKDIGEIIESEIMLLPVDKVKATLERYGVTKEKLMKAVKELRKVKGNGTLRYDIINEEFIDSGKGYNFYVTKSCNLGEQSINLIVRKQFYINSGMAHSDYIVRPHDGIVKQQYHYLNGYNTSGVRSAAR